MTRSYAPARITEPIPIPRLRQPRMAGITPLGLTTWKLVRVYGEAADAESFTLLPSIGTRQLARLARR